jgi:hypothetical protein
MAVYSKAISAVVAAVIAVLVVFNVEVSEEVQATIITVAVGLVTLLAPKNADA